MGLLVPLVMMINTRMAITWLKSSSTPYILQEKKTIERQVIESCELLSNIRYYITSIEHSMLHITPRNGNIKKPYNWELSLKVTHQWGKPVSSRHYFHTSKLRNITNYHYKIHLSCHKVTMDQYWTKRKEGRILSIRSL